jgi:hypothetical protein
MQINPLVCSVLDYGYEDGRLSLTAFFATILNTNFTVCFWVDKKKTYQHVCFSQIHSVSLPWSLIKASLSWVWDCHSVDYNLGLRLSFSWLQFGFEIVIQMITIWVWDCHSVDYNLGLRLSFSWLQFGFEIVIQLITIWVWDCHSVDYNLGLRLSFSWLQFGFRIVIQINKVAVRDSKILDQSLGLKEKNPHFLIGKKKPKSICSHQHLSINRWNCIHLRVHSPRSWCAWKASNKKLTTERECHRRPRLPRPSTVFVHSRRLSRRGVGPRRRCPRTAIRRQVYLFYKQAKKKPF